MERAVALAPLDAVSHGCLADALWQAGEKEAALGRVREALHVDPGYEWAWSALRRWAEALGRRSEAEDVARELTVSRPGEALVVEAGRDAVAARRSRQRLAALDRSLALNPQLQDAHDLKAVLLAEAGRLDEAEAACRAPAWNGSPPLILRGRLAWLAARRGDVPAAIAAMRAALAEDRDYHWGWSQMADWLRECGTPEEYREAGDNLVRLAPGGRSATATAARGAIAPATRRGRRTTSAAPSRWTPATPSRGCTSSTCSWATASWTPRRRP